MDRIRQFFDLSAKSESERKTFHLLSLLAMAALIIIAWQFYYGRLMMYPFTLYATWFHEMSHGTAAILASCDFVGLQMSWDGSGVASFICQTEQGALANVFRLLAGPVGPSIAGAILIVAGRSYRVSGYLLHLLAGAMLASAVVLSQSWVTFGLVSAMGWTVLLATRLSGPTARVFITQFLGVQAAISMYYHVGYFFSTSPVADTARAAAATGLPVSFWAVAVIAFNVLVLAAALIWSFWPSRRGD